MAGKKKLYRYFMLLAIGMMAIFVSACARKGQDLEREAGGKAGQASGSTEADGAGGLDEAGGAGGAGGLDEAGEAEVADCYRRITHITENGSIQLSLPQGWAYQVSEQEEGEFSIDLHPQSEPEGTISIQYVKLFGVCGTGLEQEDCVINGKEAAKGIYDGHEYWDYIAFSGKYENYAVLNSAGDSWWGAYQEQIEGILNSLSLGNEVKGGPEVVELEEGEPIEMGDSGKELCVTLEDTEEDVGASIHLSYGEQKAVVADYVDGLRECYVLRQDGPYFYVLVGEAFPNDAGGTYLMKVSEDGIEQCDYLEAVLREDVTANYIEAACKIDVLGSYLGIKHYGILEDKFYTDEQVFEFFQVQEGVLRKQLALLQDVPANLYGETKTLEKGAILYPTGCDTERRRFYFEYENPKYPDEMLSGFLNYQIKEEGFGCTVEGTNEYELFEGLPYAG